MIHPPVSPVPSVSPVFLLVAYLLLVPEIESAALRADSVLLRYADPPALVFTSTGPEWRAAVDSAPPVSLPALIGARVGFSYDFDLDGVADATDSLGISPADCRDDGASGPGRIALRRRLGASRDAAVLRADLITAADSIAARHDVFTGGAGALLRLARF